MNLKRPPITHPPPSDQMAQDVHGPKSQWSRRRFLQATAAVAAGSLLLPELQTRAASDQVSPGYTLISPMFTGQTFLIDLDQKVVHTWDLKHLSGGTAHLLPDGTLLQSGIIDKSDWFPDAIRTGGLGYTSLYNWNGDLLWDYTLHSETQLSHHSIKPMPNGNVMLIVYERVSSKDAIAAGRDPALIPKGKTELWLEALIEVDPKTNGTVWEWHLRDHLVQDFASSAANYGDPAAHPELIDFNYAPPFPNFQPNYSISVDWIHANAVDFNPTFNQVLFNARELSEIWIIDHSTTTGEAASHAGGKYGKGGDLLYRWGNPQAHRAGTKDDQILWFHHGSKWIEEGLPGAGNILIYDDGSYISRGTSRAVEVAVPQTGGKYDLSAGKPTSADIAWQYQIATADFSFIMGAVQRLPNNNTLITNGFLKKVLEVTHDGDIVWTWSDKDNYLFTVDRFLPTYPAFSGKSLG